MKTFIYILIDPVTDQIKYVGKSNNPKQTLKDYCNLVEFKPTCKFSWIKSLRSKNLKPIMKIIDEVNIEEWKVHRRYWISFFEIWGFDLFNYDDN